MATWLEGLPLEVVEQVEDSVAWPDDAPARLHELKLEADAWGEVPDWPRAHPASAALEAASQRQGRKLFLEGRKAEQVRALAECLGGLVLGPGHLVDWCAGKGHLGRAVQAALGFERRRCAHVERQSDLNVLAEREADRLGHALTVHTVDVQAACTDHLLQGAALAFGLHACGDLGLLLFEGGGRVGVPVAVAPCCYHRTARIGALSRMGASCAPPLDAPALRLTTSEEVVAPGRRRALRRREQAWRLGLDLLVRQCTGAADDAPTCRVPAVGRQEVDLPFADFCRLMAARHGLPLPSRWDAARAEAAAWERCRRARALGLLRQFFRRPLEVWLVLDRCCWLTEQGREASWGAFCPRRLTPRNLLILAR